jgi:ribosomal protein S1
VGDLILGTVMNIEAYGAFVDLGDGVGLLHNSQISNEKVEAAGEILNREDKIKVGL